MTTLAHALQRLELQQYYEVFVKEGFDSWETVLDIQESDLVALDVKLGHRRKLQRAIAEYRGISSDRPLNSPRQDGVQDMFGPDRASQQPNNDKHQTLANKEQKRRYRRHPKTDVNAPEKPPSAYVLFSNKVRDEVKSQNLSFTEIARLVGDRWQKLEPEEKRVFENRASDSKDEYNRLLADYKKTDDYKRHLNYLADFRAKHGGQDSATPNDHKRPKLTSDLNSNQDTEEGQTDKYDAFQARLQHERAASISSMSITSRSETQPQTSPQMLTSLLPTSAELCQRSPEASNSLSEFRHLDRMPAQIYGRRERTDFMDVDNSHLTGISRYDSPSTDTSHSGQSFLHERTADGDSTPGSRRGQAQFTGSVYPSSGGPNLTSDLSIPPISSSINLRNRSNPWEYSPENTHQPFSTAPPPAPATSVAPHYPARPSNIVHLSPITQLVNLNQDFGERTLPPIHRLGTTPSYRTPALAAFTPTPPEHTQSRPIRESETIAFHLGSQQRNEPHVNVNVKP